MATLCGNKRHSGLSKVYEHRSFAVFDNRAYRHRQNQIGCAESAAVVAHAWAAIIGPAMRCAVVAEQRGHLGVTDQNDVPCIATVATIRAREWFELFPAHRNTTVAAVSGAQMEGDLIDEGCHRFSLP